VSLSPSLEAALTAGTESRTSASGADGVHYLAWNPHETAKPALLFAHGHRGHARWWSPIAPFFTDRFRVFALDFSGMGDSPWRSEYLPETFIGNLLDVMDAERLESATLAGHSFGGSIVLRAAAAAPRRVSHAIVIDSWLRFPEVEVDADPPPLRVGRGGLYPDYASIRARYRLLPEQPVACAELLEFVARHSVIQEASGWRWKFDPALPQHLGPIASGAILPTIRTRTDYVYGSLSALVDAARAAKIVESLPNGRAPVAIPDAHHHVMLDQPRALVTALRGLLA